MTWKPIFAWPRVGMTVSNSGVMNGREFSARGSSCAVTVKVCVADRPCAFVALMVITEVPGAVALMTSTASV